MFPIEIDYFGSVNTYGFDPPVLSDVVYMPHDDIEMKCADEDKDTLEFDDMMHKVSVPVVLPEDGASAVTKQKISSLKASLEYLHFMHDCCEHATAATYANGQYSTEYALVEQYWQKRIASFT